MIRKIIQIFVVVLTILSSKCQNNTNTNTNTNNSSQNSEVTKENMDNLKLFIDNLELDVSWSDSQSLKEIKELANNNLEIKMNRYSNFEQVGKLNKTISSSDKRIETSPGDICLYASNQIVIFYGSNTWEYTFLGHINMSKEELSNILDKTSVTALLKLS